MANTNRSRLNRTLEKKTKYHMYLYLLGIVVILFVLIKFGVPALINFSLFLAHGKDQAAQTTASSSQSPMILTPPTLSQTFSATNSATITVSGTAAPKQKVELYVNNNLSDIVDTKNDGSFTFKEVTLISGQNTIEAKAKVDNKESDFSEPLTISYEKSAPSLTIDSPQDNQTFSGSNQQDITVRGKTDNNNIHVTVNGFWATLDANGNYSYTLHLQNGSNQIKVIAQDEAGNQTEKDVTVNFNQ